MRQIAARINQQMSAPVIRVGASPRMLNPLSTGFAALDAITGLDGLPRGRITELIGRPTSGRETMATRCAAATDGHTAWIDVADALDVAYLAEQGVDLERLIVVRPPDGQPLAALAMAERLVTCGHLDLIVLDAVADLPPGGRTSAALGRFTRVITPALAEGQAALIALSSPEYYHRPLAHAAAVRIALHRVGFLRRGGVLRGWRTRAEILKSPGTVGGESGLEMWR